MNSYWYLFESELHSDTCKEISNQWNDLEAHKGKVGDGDPKLDNYIRQSKIMKFPYGTDRQNAFAELLLPYITIANKECFGFHLNGFSEFQLAEYDVGDFYIEHIDTGLTDTESERKLSITIQLTPSHLYQGGHFCFGSSINTPDTEKLKQQGSILVFPSIFPHYISKVESGKRLALVGWYEGNKWK